MQEEFIKTKSKTKLQDLFPFAFQEIKIVLGISEIIESKLTQTDEKKIFVSEDMFFLFKIQGRSVLDHTETVQDLLLKKKRIKKNLNVSCQLLST